MRAVYGGLDRTNRPLERRETSQSRQTIGYAKGLQREREFGPVGSAGSASAAADDAAHGGDKYPLPLGEGQGEGRAPPVLVGW